MKCLWVLFLCFFLAGCSTLTLPKEPTVEQRIQALCQDAQMGFAIAQIILKQRQVNAAENNWWIQYEQGAEAAVKLYCARWVQ
jgi:hypothetical protein